MDFGLSEVHTQIQATIRTFMKRECPRETAHALDDAGTPPIDLLAKVAEMGFCTFNVPEDFGGAGPDMLGAALVTEALASASPSLAALYAGLTFTGGAALSSLASPEQQARWLPQVAGGELAVSIVGGGDLEPSIVTEPSPDGFRLSGQAPSIHPFWPDGLLLIQARHDDGLTWFTLPAGSPGVQVAPKEMVGLRGTTTVSAIFEDVPAGPDDVLGGAPAVKRGAAQTVKLLAVGRLATAATALGLAQGAVDYAAAYAKQRTQFGRTIAEFEAVLHMLVDLTVDLDAARWQLYRACWLADQDQPFGLAAAVAALQAGDVARRAGLQGVHILGGYGYMAEYDSARYLRDALMGFGSGEASQLLKTAIGDLAGLRQAGV